MTPRVALFDLDGTLTRRDTYLAYLLGFLARRPQRWWQVAPLGCAVLAHLTGRRDNTWLKTTFLRRVMGGEERETVKAWTTTFLDRVWRTGLRARAPEIIARHRDAGDRLLLVTASLDLYAEPLAERLAFDAVVCTRAAFDAEGRITGALADGNCYGPRKLERVRDYLERHAPGAVAVCYTDHHTDLPLLQWVAEPIAVNPTARLRREAIRHGIPIQDWNRLPA